MSVPFPGLFGRNLNLRKENNTMKLLLLCCVTVAATLLAVPRPAVAASLSINDATVEGSIIFSVGQFDTGTGFTLDGTQILAPSLGTASATVSEGSVASGPITHTFTGQFVTSGALSSPTSGTIAFTEAGGGISDILTFSYTGGGPGGVATLTGSFVSDVEGGTPLVAPPGATLVSESTAFAFNNTNITASAISDAADVPEPSTLAFFGTGLVILGFAFLRRQRLTPNKRT